MKSAVWMKSKTDVFGWEWRNEIPKALDEVTDVMKSAKRMKLKTYVFSWD